MPQQRRGRHPLQTHQERPPHKRHGEDRDDWAIDVAAPYLARARDSVAQFKAAQVGSRRQRRYLAGRPVSRAPAPMQGKCKGLAGDSGPVAAPRSARLISSMYASLLAFLFASAVSSATPTPHTTGMVSTPDVAIGYETFGSLRGRLPVFAVSGGPGLSHA